MSPSLLRRLAAGLGFLGVALGAFGAHALQATLGVHGTTEAWKTAVLYHLVHAVVLLALSARPAARSCAVWLFVGGIALFSGSLYLYALTLLKPLVFFTPAGGALLLAGWLVLLIAPE